MTERNKEIIIKLLNRMDPSLQNSENEILAAGKALHRVLKEQNQTFADLLKPDPRQEPVDLKAKNKSLHLEINSLKLSLETLNMKYEKLLARFEARKPRMPKKLPGIKNSGKPKVSVASTSRVHADSEVRAFAAGAESRYRTWMPLSSLHRDFCKDYPASPEFPLTRFSLLLKKYLKRNTVRGDEGQKEKGFLFFG